jgi:hypothetical protein
MSQRHGTPIRGLDSTKSSFMPQGRFGRLFRSLPRAKFGATEDENVANLSKLGSAMVADFEVPKVGKDEEESGIPALYTYLGQFIDHDITFDPASSLQKQDDPDALVDFRTPAFDLDNVYGRGPDDQPYLYDGGKDGSGKTFLLGSPIKGGIDPNATDLPRNNANPSRALIGDPRNDENVIVSQLQGLFLRFHNRTVADNPGLPFEEIQKLVRFHYQYMVLNDFLPRVVHSSVIKALQTNGHYDQSKLKFFHWKNGPFMPVEFSVAGYRLGHSMVRPGYQLNDSDATLLPIFPVPNPRPPAPPLPEGLTGFRAMNQAWGIDWGRFIDVDLRTYDGTPDENKKRLQFAYRLDTSLVMPLSNLPPAVVNNPSAINPPSLPARNLLRGWRMGLPSAQDVAEAMGVKPLDDKDIIIGKGIDSPGPGDQVGSITTISKVFAHNCPLWTYVLAEAMKNQETVKVPVKEDVSITTPRLGAVGGRIVAEVFLGLMFGDNHSLLSLSPNWQPEGNPNYALKDFVGYALGMPKAIGKGA